MNNANNKLFFCYSFKLAYFIKSQGIDYINKGKNKHNNLSYFVFEKSEKLDEVICEWNKLKSKKENK